MSLYNKNQKQLNHNSERRTSHLLRPREKCTRLGLNDFLLIKACKVKVFNNYNFTYIPKNQDSLTVRGGCDKG